MVGRGSCSLASRHHNCHCYQHKGRLLETKRLAPTGGLRESAEEAEARGGEEERVKRTEESLSVM